VVGEKALIWGQEVEARRTQRCKLVLERLFEEIGGCILITRGAGEISSWGNQIATAFF
jgi:hypothetical protein